MVIKLKQLYAKKDKKKKKDNKKKTPALSAFSAPRPTTTASASRPLATTASASRPLATNSKTAVTSTGKKINIRRPDKSRLKTLVKEGRCFIYKEQDYTSRNCPHKKKIKQLRKAYI